MNSLIKRKKWCMNKTGSLQVLQTYLGSRYISSMPNVDWVSGACIFLHQSKGGQNAYLRKNSRAIVKNSTQEISNCR